MYTISKRSNYVSQTTDLVSIAVFFGRARMYTSTKRSGYVSQTIAFVNIAVFFWACVNVHKYQDIKLHQSNN